MIPYASIDDKDLDDAALWAVIDSAAAAAAAAATTTTTNSHSPSTKPHKHFSKHLQSPPTPVFNNHPNNNRNNHLNNHRNHLNNRRGLIDNEGEVVHEPRPMKMFRRMSFGSESSNSPMAIVKNVQRTPPMTPANVSYYTTSSPESYLSPGIGAASVSSPATGSDDTKHSLSGKFPSVSLFKDFQNAAMAILEKTDYTMISGHPFIKKSGWRKMSFYFNISFEIKDKTIEFDENRNVLRAEFIVRAHMQGGRFSDGWGSCERREKKFLKPNHDVPSTAETRAKNKACQDLLGIGEYRPGASQVQR